jgi:hypothetical protein
VLGQEPAGFVVALDIGPISGHLLGRRPGLEADYHLDLGQRGPDVA